MDETMPELDQETTLKALVLAISICAKNLTMDTVKNLKLTCRESDFRHLLRHRNQIIVDITSPNLRELQISFHEQEPALSEFINGNLNWPCLEKLNIDYGSIASIRHELYLMRALKSLHLCFYDSNKYDRKALLRMPFLGGLTNLELSIPSNCNELYMSRLFSRTQKLKRLDLSRCFDYDYFGGEKIETLDELHLTSVGVLHLGPLLAHPRTNLRKLSMTYSSITNEDLADLIERGKVVFPNIASLKFGEESWSLADDGRYDEVFIEAANNQDWNCLSRIDFLNLTHLSMTCGFKQAIGIVSPTANLPKLKSLLLADRVVSSTLPPQDWEDNAEAMFSSSLLHQLEKLRIRNINFWLKSLSVFCKYASQYENLQGMHVHAWDLRGVQMIAAAGRKGGFPKLNMISFYDMDTAFYFFVKCGRIGSSTMEMHDSQIALLLRSVWPDIRYFVGEASTRVVKNYKSDTFCDETVADDEIEAPTVGQLDAALEELQNIQI